MKIMFVGCGNMGSALVEGLANSDYGHSSEIYLNDSIPAKAQSLNERLQLNGVVGLGEAGKMDAIVIAVKPDMIATVSEALKPFLLKTQLIISIAAGLSLSSLRIIFPENALCRVMPNIAALVGEACSSLSFDGTNQKQEILAEHIFSTCGRCFILPEKYIDAVVGLSGSGPAYCMLMIEALADGGVKTGLPRDIALSMAIQTLKGSATLLDKKELHPAMVKDMVCSPGGTSIAAVQALEERGLRAALIAAVESSANRNREIAKQGH